MSAFPRFLQQWGIVVGIALVVLWFLSFALWWFKNPKGWKTYFLQPSNRLL